MHSIIVTEIHEGISIAEIIALYSVENGVALPISECLVTLDKVILDYDQVYSTIPSKGQEIKVFRLAYGG